jgi:hypothetical protein
LAVQLLDCTVNFLNTLKSNLATSSLLFGNAGSELFVETLDLVKLGAASVLADTLLAADLVGFGDQFLTALLGRRRSILVLARGSEVDLGLDGILVVGVSIYYADCVEWARSFRDLVLSTMMTITYIFGHRVLVLLLSRCQTLIEEFGIGLLGLFLVGRCGSSSRSCRDLGHGERYGRIWQCD